MSRPTSHLPKYRHYKPKNLAVVRLGGKDHYLGRYDSPESRERYWRLVSEWNLTGSVNAPGAPAPGHDPAPLTVSELILAFWRHGEAYYRHADGTPTGELENYRHALRPLKAAYGTTPARDFGPLALKAVRQRMVDSGLSRQVVNRRVKRVVRVFSFGVENELVPAATLQALREVKSLLKGRSGAREAEPVGTAPDADVDAALPFLSRQLRAVAELQRLSGMRSNEALVMRTGDVDRSGPVWTYTPGRHKGEHLGKARQVALGPRAQEVLRPWLRADPDAFLFQPREAMGERRAERRKARATPMTPSQRGRKPKAKPRRAPGERYTPRSYARAVRVACARAGVANWHPHQLRHNAGTRLRREYGLEVARCVLGHNSTAVTEVYAERDMGRARDVMAQIG